VRAIKDTGTATAGASWQPVVGDWTIEAGGTPFTMIGEDDIATDCVRVFYLENKPDISLRVDGLNFQINYNRGGGWVTWATGEECV
jgi:hypothetical protein